MHRLGCQSLFRHRTVVNLIVAFVFSGSLLSKCPTMWQRLVSADTVHVLELLLTLSDNFLVWWLQWLSWPIRRSLL